MSRRLLTGAAVFVLAGCGTQVALRPSAAPTATPTAAPTFSLPPTPPPTQAPSAVGQTITTTTFRTFTVLQYVDHFSSDNEFETPAPGGFFAAINVKECASPTATASANPYDWVLFEPDQSRIQPGFVSGKDPQLNAADLQPNECVTGWVSFTVPVKPTLIAVKNSDLRWAVP